MIASFFTKSKPINFIVISLFVCIAFVFYVISDQKQDKLSVITSVFALVLVVFYFFFLGFIISKNELTKKHSYGIMIFGLLVLIFPQVFEDINILIANLLVLLSMRRLFSLHTKRNLKIKFFDAVFWISLASLFYAWSSLFLIVVFFALAYYWQNEGKYLIVALLALLAVFILLIVYNIIAKDVFVLPSNFDVSFSFNFSSYNSFGKIAGLAAVATIYIWSLVFYFKRKVENKKLKPILFLVFIGSLVAITIAVLAPEKTGKEYIFLFIPFSIIVANYIETIEERWFKELFISLLILVPIVRLML